MSRDPVCGREVDALRARAVGIWGGRTYYFCSPEHRDVFAKDPSAYRDGAASGPVPVAAMQQRSERADRATSGRVAAVPAPTLPSGPVASGRVSSPPAASPELPEAIPHAIDRTSSGGTAAPPELPRQDSGPLAPARKPTGLYIALLVAAVVLVGLIGFFLSSP